MTGTGHAPGAKAVGVSITAGTNMGNPPPRWTTDTAYYLEAVQVLRGWILAVVGRQVHVLNISFDGWPDPEHPVELALDSLAHDEDILVVVAASNTFDETGLSHGLYNGLSVGSVHARAEPMAPFVPMAQTARGPLRGRFYPDVCATGAGSSLQYSTNPFYPFTSPGGSAIRMPLINIASSNITFVSTCSGTATAVYDAIGTSMAAPQVSGAAALYRSARPGASAVETRAAILACVADPYAPNGSADRHTYRSRNTYGVGYVRDDLLAEYATRGSANPVPVNAVGQAFVVTPKQPDFTFTYGGLTAGQRVAVALAWERPTPDADPPPPLASLDLEVRKGPGGPLVAASRSPANSHERLCFDVPSGVTSVEVRVIGMSLDSDTSGYVAGRSFPGGAEPPQQEAVVGMVEDLPQVPTCTMPSPVPDLSVGRIVPREYADAWGSWAFAGPLQNAGFAYTSMNLTNADPNSSPPQPLRDLHIEIDGDSMGESISSNPPMTIGGIALRLWRPFEGPGGNLVISNLYVWQSGDFAPWSANAGSSLSGSAMATNVTIEVPPASWIARRMDSWSVIIPFDPGQSFTYSGNDPITGQWNLHVWFDFDDALTDFRIDVDAADDRLDPQPQFGPYAFRRQGLSVSQRGAAPILGLIPVATTTSHPRLQVFGQPDLGHTLRFKLTRADPSSTFGACLLIGFPGTGSRQGCSILVDPATAQTLCATTSAFGEANFNFPIPINTGLLFDELWLQGGTLPSDRLSNGLVLRIGGGL